jgi:hypothetical protein
MSCLPVTNFREYFIEWKNLWAMNAISYAFNYLQLGFVFNNTQG